MYGTIARLRLKPGMEARIQAEMDQFESQDVPGFVSTTIYRSDSDPNELFMVVMFDSREAYRANAESPGQNDRYLKLLEILDGVPEWHDGEIIHQIRSA